MKLMVIDGNSIVNRAFYGVRPLTTKDGVPTNAVYGFLNILQKLMGEETPDAVCVTFDLKAPTFRHARFAEYKAQRKGMPEELVQQMPILKEVLDAMRIRRYELEGWEADDLIGTIAAKCEEAGWECTIVTGDKDSFQLITETTHVKHVKTRMGQTETKEMDLAAFWEEYGFAPIRMIDLKALMGDSSDNIPGVAGIGEKTALDLIRRFDTVERIYAELDTLDIRDTVRKKLQAGRESAEMSFALATIMCDAPVEFSPEENLCMPVDQEALYAVFKRLEFTKMIEKFGLVPGNRPKNLQNLQTEMPVIYLKTKETVADFQRTAVDTVVGIACTDGLEMVVAVTDAAAYVLEKTSPVWDAAAAFLFSTKVQKAGHGIKDTMRCLLYAGLPIQGWIFDTELAAYLLQPTENTYTLERLAEDWCGLTLKDTSAENEQLRLLDDTREIREKCISLATVIRLLKEKLEKQLLDLSMDKLYYEIELPLCSVLAEMEYTGVLVDQSALTAFGETLTQGIDILQQSIYGLAGEKFNINSPKQLGMILFEKLMLPAPKKTKTGWSTNMDVLEKLVGKHPIVQQIMDYRQFTKLKSTYSEGLLKVIAPDGRIHTTFQMTVTATGRLSSTEPNLQNIPVRTELGGELRKMFVAGEGNVLVDADYSQIELRLLAHISGDQHMIAAFNSGEDIHAVTASQVFNTPLAAVSPLQRSRAKAVNFGIVYGISPFSLSQDIKVSVAEAKRYMDSYLENYSGVRTYMQEVVHQAKEAGYAVTLFGRRRALPELKSSNFNVRSFGERVALNMPIQGTAADIMKLAMIHVYGRLKQDVPEARLLLQIHDELIVECPRELGDKVADILKEEMESVARISVPLTADAHCGKSWYEAK